MKGRSLIIQKIVAMILIIIIILAETVIAGKTAISYAIDMLATNSNNVEFNAYFMMDNSNLSEIEKEITAKDLKLNIDVAVKNEGYFNGQIAFDNAGFKLNENIQNEYVERIENNIVYLKTINADEIAKIEVGINYFEEESIETSTLDRKTKVKLEGTYYNSKKEEKINGEKEIRVKWIAPEDAKLELKAKILTNKYYNAEGENKRVVQLLISSKISNNNYPIKKTEIETTIPDGATIKEVHKRTTRGTNGNKEFTEQNYRIEDGKIKIDVLNDEIEGKINWAKNAEDIFVVTYEYIPELSEKQNESNYETEEKINIKGKITTYEDKELEENIEIKIEEEQDGIVTIDTKEAESEIYKGKIYAGEEREYKTYTRIYVDYVEGIKDIKANEKRSEYLIKDETTTVAQAANIQYKKVKFNKENIRNLLGEEWKITLIDDSNNRQEITNEKETDEQGNIEINFQQDVEEISIETSKPVKVGIIEYEVTKAIEKAEYTREELKEVTNIRDTAEVEYTKNDNETNKKEKTNEISLKETETKATLEINKSNLATQNINENIEVVAKLQTTDERYNLYKNPEVDIAFPKEIKDVTVKQAKALYRNGVEIESNKKYIKEDGRMALYVKFKGEQNTYDTNGGLELHFYLDIQAEKLEETKKEQIELKYTNENDGTEKIIKKEIELEATEELKTQQETNVERFQESNKTNENTTKEINTKTETHNNQPTNQNNISNTTNNQPTKQSNVPNTANSQSTNQNTELPKKPSKQDSKTALLRTQIVAGVEADIVGILGNNELDEGSNVFEGETIKYEITLRNNSDKDYTNISVKATQTNGKVWNLIPEERYNPFYNENVIQNGYNITDSNEIEMDKIDKLEKGKSVMLVYEATADTLGEETNKTTFGTIEIKSDDGELNKSIKTVENNIKKAEVNVKLKEVFMREVVWNTNADAQIKAEIKNLTSEELKNVELKFVLPKETKLDTSDIKDRIRAFEFSNRVEVISIDKRGTGDTVVTTKITNILPSEEISIYVVPVVLKTEQDKVNIRITAQAKTESNNIYYSNEIARDAYSMENRDIKVEQKVYLNKKEINSKLLAKDGDEIEIEINIINNDNTATDLNIKTLDNLTKGISPSQITIIKNNEQKDASDGISDSIISFDYNEIGANEQITVIIKAKINTNSLLQNKNENTVIVTDLKTGRKYTSKYDIYVDVPVFELPKQVEEEDPEVTVIEGEEKPNQSENGKNNDNPNGDKSSNENGNNNNSSNGNNSSSNENNNENSSNNNENTNVDKKYTISGLAWIDSNKNGKKDSNESTKSDIEVKIINANTGKLMDGSTKTEQNGNYTLEVTEGKYIVVFLYDTNKYGLTTYQIKGANNTENSDVVSKKYTIEGSERTVGATDELNVKENINNIDIGLVEKQKFDMKLDKYVSKVIVTNKQGTKTKTYKNNSLAKVEIKGKYISGSIVLVEYTLKVTNTGEVAGYVSEITDKIPSGLKYQSKLNSNWYMKGNTLYNEELAKQKIEPGETKEVKLVLTKTMTKSNTGLFKNTAYISKTKNESGIEDIKSENNQSSGELIISISTGEAIRFVALVIAAAILTSTGVSILVKKYFIER